VALAVGRLLGLDAQRLNWAIGLAASQSSGFRATHGTMTAHFRPGHATRAGVFAALLAEQGFDSAEDALESDKGFADVFAAGADLSRATERLGAHFELLQNAYKPYPCGIVIHPTIDACLDIRSRLPQNARFSRVVLRVHPLVLKLTDVRTPRTPLESHISVYHWAAVALLHGKAGLPETQQPCIDDPIVAALRASIEVVADATVDRGAAHVTVDLEGKPPPQAVVKAARGSVERPMTDGELDEKFLSQATMVLSRDRSHRLLAACRSIRSCPDVGGAIGALLTS
jgi:2-methylcitrate dehydratase PrpD